jgi:large subunit ribosomal protein L15
MKLEDLRPAEGARPKKKRLGRGIGSGLGKTSGKGHKGQNARAGGGVRPGFEGGQMPLQRRMPKRGFKNPGRLEYQVVNLDALDRLEEAEVTPEVLRAHRLARTDAPIKVLAGGELHRAVIVRAHAFSREAERRIVEAGGKAEVV